MSVVILSRIEFIEIMNCGFSIKIIDSEIYCKTPRRLVQPSFASTYY